MVVLHVKSAADADEEMEFLYVCDASAAVADRRRCRARLPTGPPAAASEVRGFTLTVPRHLSFRRWSMTRT